MAADPPTPANSDPAAGNSGNGSAPKKRNLAEAERDLKQANENASDWKQRAVTAVIVGVLAFLGLFAFMKWSDPTEEHAAQIKAEKQEVVRLQGEYTKLKAAHEELKKKPPIQVVEGLSKEACTAVATAITDKSCKGETVVKWRDRVVAGVATAQADAGAQARAAAQAAADAKRKTVVVEHSCTARDRKTGKVENFRVASQNYRGIVVTTGAECYAARQQYVRDHPNAHVVENDPA